MLVPGWCTIQWLPSDLECYADMGTIPLQSTMVSDLVAKRMLRVEANFDEILEDYLSTRLPTVGGGDS